MILTILAVLIFAFGFFCWWRHTERDDFWDGENWFVGSLFCWVIGGICTLIAIIFIIDAAVENDITTDNLIEQRNAIEYRLEQCDEDTNIMVNGGVYNDMVEYNNTIRKYKKWSHNPWIGWFWADGPAELEYIALPNKGS
jgi:hypothetical protein